MGFTKIDSQEWQKRCLHIVKVEDKYIEHEFYVDILPETNELRMSLDDDNASDIIFGASDDEKTEDNIGKCFWIFNCSFLLLEQI